MEFWDYDLSNNEIGILLDQNEAEKMIKILNILFEYIVTILGPKMAIIISVTFSSGINCPVAEKKLDFALLPWNILDD